MPNPLIFLECHNDPTTRQFITNNIAELKKLGYKKVLFEISKT